MTSTQTDAVAEFWNKQSCGEVYASGESPLEQFRTQAETRYKLEPFIRDFAKFDEATGKDVLEIGVGMGADHLEWAKAKPRKLIGVDITERAAKLTAQRLTLEGFSPDVRVMNAEYLPFKNDSFDIIYSWGVLHHSPRPLMILGEIFRVLKPAGVARIMLYNKYSFTGLWLWLRYGWRDVTLKRVYARRLESPGTKAFSARRIAKMFRGQGFALLTIKHHLSASDLLEGSAGQRHQGAALSLAKKIAPRSIINRFPRFGLFTTIEAYKPPATYEMNHIASRMLKAMGL